MPRIRSLCVSKDNKKLLVGTFGSEIYELFDKDGNDIGESNSWDYKCLMKGHYTPNPLWTNEVWGLDTLKTNRKKFGERYLTCSDDATLRLYSVKSRKLLNMLKLDVDKKGKKLKYVKIKGFKGKGMPEKATARCVGISNDDTMIVVGMKDGTVWVISCDPDKENLGWKKKKIFRHAKKWISEIKFSPDNQKCVIGDHNQRIWVYETTGPKAWKKSRPMLKHSSAIIHMDWS